MYELNLKTPFYAIEKWYKIKSERLSPDRIKFPANPSDIKNKILSLKSDLKTSSHKQS